MAHITSVRLKAFKSVGSAWVEVPFDRGLNAIVGPNGCGKSSLLDALCFAFAAPLKSFAAASLTDLACSDSSEVCEVVVQLQAGRGAARKVHTVQAALTPDGSRTFKVDGRARSGKEVRDFLRGLGISLDSAAAVIKQAQVTQLADSNSPGDLAAVIAEASGLGRWNDEVAAASEELKRTRKALAEVQANLLNLERSVAANQDKLREVERFEQMEHEAASLAQQLAGLLQQAVGACRSAAAANAVEGQQAAHSLVDASRTAQQCQEELEAAKQQLSAARQRQTASAHKGGAAGHPLLSLQQQAVALEEEVRLLVEQLDRQQHLEARRQDEQAAAERMTSLRSRLDAELAACRHAQLRVAADLHLAESASSHQELQASLAAEERSLAKAVAEKEQSAQSLAAGAEATAALLKELQTERQRLSAVLAAAEAASSSSSMQQRSTSQALVQRWQAALQALQQQEQELLMESGTLAARLGGSTGVGSTARWRLLHQCFSFKNPQQAQPYANALQILAGKRLGIVVADSMATTATLLEAGSGARIWPLDSLVAADHVHQQRRAAQSFPSGQVVVPEDLLAFEPRFRPAILRAFGSHVIAASDAVAEQLITRFGIPSITLDGKQISRGTLQGGWRGSGGASSIAAMSVKVLLDAAVGQLADVRHQLASAQESLEAALQQLQHSEQAAEAVNAAAADLAALQGELRACELQHTAQLAGCKDAQAALGRLQAELSAKRGLLQSLQHEAAKKGQGPGAGAQAALVAEQQRLNAAAAALQAEAAATAVTLAKALAEAAAAEDELATLQLQGVVEQLDAKRAELTGATAALQLREAELAAAADDLAAMQLAVDAAAGKLAAAQEALAVAEADVASHQVTVGQQAAVELELQQQLAALLKQLPELHAVIQPDAGGGQGEGASSLAAFRKSCAQLAKRRSKLLEEQKHSAAARIPLSEQLRFREQQASLAAAQQQATTLQTAALRLEEGIHISNAQVLITNEDVFSAIDRTFQSLIAAVLPAYHVRLSKVGQQVHDGVRLEFAEKSCCWSEQGSSSWRAALDVLSGGQRTMVSLTFVIAAAMAGSATSLFLMDEVDAALDETNQHMVARLFDTLSSNASVACSQVLCVSHNAGFQQLCQRVVRLTRGAKGTVLADGDRGGGTVSQSGAEGQQAGAVVRGKKAKLT